MTTMYDKLRAAHSKALDRCKDPDLLVALLNAHGSTCGRLDDITPEKESILLATLRRIGNGTRAPVAFASVRRGAAPAGRVYVNDEEIDEDDAAYVAEQIANPGPAAAKAKPTLESIAPAAWARWNAAKKKIEE